MKVQPSFKEKQKTKEKKLKTIIDDVDNSVKSLKMTNMSTK